MLHINYIISSLNLTNEEAALLLILCAREYCELNQKSYGNLLIRQALEYELSISTISLVK